MTEDYKKTDIYTSSDHGKIFSTTLLRQERVPLAYVSFLFLLILPAPVYGDIRET